MPNIKSGIEDFMEKHLDVFAEKQYWRHERSNPTIREIINIARVELKYSTKTSDQDIFLTLKGVADYLKKYQ
jgi:hypothetical protein